MIYKHFWNIFHSHSEDYNDWVNICRILVNISKSDIQNIEKYISMFHEFSSRSNKYDPDSCTLKWENIFNSYEIGLAGPGIGSLIFIAKENGFEGEVGRLFIPINDYDIANAVKKFTKDQYITHKFGCFKIKTTYWKELQSSENDFRNTVAEWADYFIKRVRKHDKAKKSYKILHTLINRIQSFGMRGSIAKALADVYYDKNVVKILNCDNTKVAFSNVVLDLIEKKIIPGNPKHYLGRKINHDYIDWLDVPEDKNLCLIIGINCFKIQN